MSLIKSTVLANWGPGGWQFFQPETNWHAPAPLQNNFHQQVKNIIKMREANPRFGLSTDPVAVAEELEQYTVARWRATYSENGMQVFLENPTILKKKAPTSTTPHPSLLGRAAALVGIDTAVVEEWLGAGGKGVPQLTANTRAQVCAQCPGNRKVGWRDALTAPAAEAIKNYLEVKHRLSMNTTLDSELGMCNPCKCYLPLKVWVPLPYIKENTKPETFDKLREANANCWVLTEK